MDTELERELEKSFKRRKQKRRMERLKKIIAVISALVLLIFVFIGFDCFKKGGKFFTGEKTLSPKEWSDYAVLKEKARELEEQQTKIRVYERLLARFQKGNLGGYTKRDSIIWARSALDLKRKFNQELKKSKYNSIMNLVPKFSDPDYLPKGFDPLPTSFVPCVLSEAELEEALKNPGDWIDYPDSTEREEPKKDAH